MPLKRILSLTLALLLALPAALAEPVPDAVHPIPGTRVTGSGTGYWETPMDITDTQAVWAMLTAPITVVKGSQKQQTVLRALPDADSEAVADITYDSQGLHVLETLDNGWSLVEAYSSSFHDSKIRAWNRLTQGYIRTDALQVKQVSRKYGLVVDKLTQRLYVFEGGELMDTLAVSTGLANEKQPYNETRSGEFLIVSPVGDFVSDNVVGAMALRFNDGDFLHEVVHIARSSGKVYEPFEKVLGERASHGCIRVQRKRTPQGTNMAWLWNNLRKHMGEVRLVIWEDVKGRQIDVPAGTTPLYYNANGGRNYHAAPTCYGVRDKFLPMTEFTYAELDDAAHAGFTPCPYCFPPLRAAEIEAINARYR